MTNNKVVLYSNTSRNLQKWEEISCTALRGKKIIHC